MSGVLPLLKVAYAEVGYLEKSSNRDLDAKTSNAGSGNFTKYWRDLEPSLQGSAWCDCFVDWCFVKAYGLSEAQRLECGGTKTYYTPTSAKYYKNAGRWQTTPIVGAQVFFHNSERICHTGIVVAFDDTTITTIEGNTSSSSGVVANGGGVFVKSYRRADSKISGYGCPEYSQEAEKMTTKQFISAVKAVVDMARKGRYTYGDSHALPPCADHIISCDRMVARALWDKGYTSQPKGGITVLNMESYLLKWGFSKIEKQSSLKAGDIVLMKQSGQSKPTAAWHTFVLTSYDPASGMCKKYDEGSQTRIDSAQPFTAPLNEWSSRSFYCGFRLPDEGPKRLPTTGTTRTIASAINKAYVLDIKGASMDQNANLQIHKANDTDAQRFIIEDVKDGFVRIINKKSGLVLDVQSGKAQNKQNVRQHEWNATKAQLWKMRKNSDMTITFESALSASYVLDVSGGNAKNATNVWLYKWNATKAQRFYIS